MTSFSSTVQEPHSSISFVSGHIGQLHNSAIVRQATTAGSGLFNMLMILLEESLGALLGPAVFLISLSPPKPPYWFP